MPIEVVSPTTGENTYIVRTPIGDEGEYRQEVLTKDEIETRGGSIPPAMERASELHQTGMKEGYAAREAKEKEFELADQAQSLARQQNIPVEQAKATIQHPERIETDFQEKNIRVGINRAGEPEYVSRVDAEAIKTTNPYGYDILAKQGLSAYETYRHQVERQGEVEFEANLDERAKQARGLEAGLADAPAELRTAYKEGGADAYEKAVVVYNRKVEARIAEFEADLKGLPEELQAAYRTGGIDGYNKAVVTYNVKVEGDAKGFETRLAAMPEVLQTAYKSGGLDAYNRAVERYNADIETSQAAYDKAEKALEPFKDKDGNYDIISYLKSEPSGERPTYKTASDKLAALRQAESESVKVAALNERAQVLRDAGFKEGDIQVAVEQSKLSLVQTYWRATTSWNESAKETVTAKGAAIMAAELVVPYVYTATHWNELSAGEKAVYIAMDTVVFVLPAAGAAVRGARTAASLGRVAMLKGAAAGLGGEAVAWARAPVDMIIHPVGTAKATARQVQNLVENIAHPRKIPESVITTSNGMVTFKVTGKTTKVEALAMGEVLTEEAAAGAHPIVKIGDQTVELASSPLMRELGGGLAHATPDIRPFEQGIKVAAKEGLPASEQGWFLSPEPALRFTESSAFGRETIPTPAGAGGKVQDIARYRADDLVRLDKRPIRELNFADAKNIPQGIAKPLQTYAEKENARLYGSFNEWVKIKKAARPNDVDLAFVNQRKAIKDVLQIAKDVGYEAKQVAHGVAIKVKDEWVKLGDIDSIAHHKSILPGRLAQETNKVGGINTEHLGEQYLRQSMGAVAKDTRASVRAAKLEKAANDVRTMLQESGVGKMKPGIFITSKETAAGTVGTEKLFAGTVEMERKGVIGFTTKPVAQKLFYRTGPMAERAEIWIEEGAKVLSPRQIAKLKAESIIETIKAPFTPAITIRGKGAITTGLTSKQTKELASVLRRSGNVDQARSLLRAEQVARASRVAIPALSRLIGRVPRREVEAARERLTRASMSAIRPERLIERAERIARPERIGRITRLERLPERIRPERIEQVRAQLSRAELRRVRQGEAPRRLGTPEAIRRAERATDERRIARVISPARLPERVEIPGRVVRPVRPPERVGRPERPARLPERPGKPIVPLVPTAIDKAKRELIKKVGAHSAINMGKLKIKGKLTDIWYVFLNNGKRVIVKGDAPEGVRITADGRGSGYKTAQKVGTGIPPEVKTRFGFMNAILKPAQTATGIQPRFTPSNKRTTLKSVRKGRIFYTKTGNATLMSRYNLGRRRG